MRSGRLEDVGLHAVTAEPGGDDEIEARLAAKGLTNLGFRLHSDPENRLLLRSAADPTKEADVFPREEFKPSFASPTSTPYVAYTIVQPALVVVHRTGKVKQAWSWKLGVLKDVEPKEPLTRAPGLGILVGVRPKTTDIAASIKEGRPVELEFQGIRRIATEALGAEKLLCAGVVMVGVLAAAVAAGAKYLRQE